MKFLLLIVLFFHFSASAYSQEAKFDIELNNASIKEVFNLIIEQSDYSFAYSDADIQNVNSVSINIKQASIDEVLQTCLKGLDLEYEINNEAIILRKADKAEPNPGKTEGEQKIIVNGKITDKDGFPLPGATILEDGTTNGVTTDKEGNFILEVEGTSSVLKISYIGFKTQLVPVGEKTEFVIVLAQSATSLDEVIISGYQTLESSRSSGAFDYIGAEEIENRPTTNLASAMDGMFTGLRVTESGFTIRGISTMTSQVKDPLIVVDGFAIEGGLSTINPNDVKFIHVLKDAAAASIWGARSSNGVIVITTKDAKAGLHVDVNMSIDIQEKLNLNKVNPIASSSDALRWEQFLWENDQIFSSFSLSSGVNGNNNPASLGITLMNLRDQGKISQLEFEQRWSQLQQTDYRKDVKKYLLENPITNNYDITISGGSERNDFILNARYIDQQGEGGLNYNGSDQFLVNFRNNYKVTPWLDAKISVMTKFTRTNNSGASMSEIRGMSPYETLVDNNGDYATMVGAHYQEFIDSTGIYFPTDWNYNLLQEVRSRKLKTEQNDIRIQAGLKIKLFKGLVYETKFQYEQYKNERNNFYSEDSYYVRDQRNKWLEYDQVNNQVLHTFVPEGGQLLQSYGTTKSYTFRNQFKYDQKFGDHIVNGGLFTEISSKTFETYTSPTAYGYNPDRLTSEVPNTYFPIESYWGTAVYQLSGMNSAFTYSNDRLFSLLGNVAYTYKNKYSFTGSFRMDASNLIVKESGERYSPFWSIGGNWQMGKEDFIKNITAIDRLNIRFSYGYSGNVVLSTSPVVLISLHNAYPLTGAQYGTIQNYGNPDLRWERTRVVNFGVDYSLFNNRIFGSIDLYDKHGKDIVGQVDLPRMTGTSTQSFNTAVIINRGIEFSINTVLPIASEASWISSFNFSYNKSEVRSLTILNYNYYALRNPHFEEGKPVNALYSYSFLGMNEDNTPVLQGVGDETFTFNDVAPSTIDDREYMEYSGSTQPKTILGWQNSISAYGFRLSVTLTGEFGHVFRRPTFDYFVLANSKASSRIHEDAMSVLNGTQEGIPAMPSGDAPNLRNWRLYSPYLNATIEDAAHIRLGEVNLSYTLPDNFVARMGLKHARVYFQARNLGILWAANDEGLDPLYISFGTPPKIYKFGISFGF